MGEIDDRVILKIKKEWPLKIGGVMRLVADKWKNKNEKEE